MAKKDAYISAVLKELRNGMAERGKVMSRFVKKWQVSERTFDRVWKEAQEIYRKESNEAEKEVAKVLIAEKVESASNGLKSKYERLMNLQRQIDNLEQELASNKMHVHAFSMGEMVIGTREMNSLEKAKIADTIKSLQSEISKIEGDYAPTQSKVENSGEIGIRTWQVVPKSK